MGLLSLENEAANRMMANAGNYAKCDADSKAFNSHEQYKVSLLMDATTDKAKKDALSFSDKEYLARLYSTPEAVLL